MKKYKKVIDNILTKDEISMEDIEAITDEELLKVEEFFSGYDKDSKEIRLLNSFKSQRDIILSTAKSLRIDENGNMIVDLTEEQIKKMKLLGWLVSPFEN